MNPKFSVVIPTYNHAHLIRRCLDSLVEQTYTSWEAIVVNNFSQDNTIDVVNSYNDPRINLVNFSNNGVIAASRNEGIRQSRGEWICFLDSDDWWKPEKLEQCIPYFNDYDFIYHKLIVTQNVSYNQIHNALPKRQLKTNNLVNDLIVNGNAICNSSVVIRKTLVEQVGFICEDKELIAVEDFDYWIRIAQCSNKFKYIHKSLGYYWIGGNISTSLKQIDREYAIYEKYKFLLSSKENQQAIKTLNFRSARIYHQNGSFQQALDQYKKLLTYGVHWKILFKSLIGIGLCLINYRS